MNNKLIPLVITLVVGIILAGSVLMPVLNDATKTTDTLENVGYFHMEKYATDEEVVISWDHTNPRQITVNNEVYSPNTPLNQWVSLAIGDNWYFRYADGGSNVYVQVTYGGINYVSGSVSGGSDVTMTCSNGTATIVQTTSGTTSDTQTAEYTELYAISGDSGEYLMKNSNETAYVAAGTEFLAIGSTSLGSGRAVLKVAGNVEDGATVEVVGSTPTGATVSDIEVNATALSNYVGFALSTITFNITVENTEYPATYSYFIVPASVTLELAEHLTPGQIALMGAIPIMVIVALLMAAVGAIALRRAD